MYLNYRDLLILFLIIIHMLFIYNVTNIKTFCSRTSVIFVQQLVLGWCSLELPEYRHTPENAVHDSFLELS